MKKNLVNVEFETERLQKLNEVVLQDEFSTRIREVRNSNITITQKPQVGEFTFPNSIVENPILKTFEDIGKYRLDAKVGEDFSKQVAFAGYDESKYKFLALEGEAHATCHSLTYYVNNEFAPVSKITFYFYTKSKRLQKDSKYIKYTDDQASEANRDYAIDRNSLIMEYALNSSILFIDGPMIGGNITSYSLDLINYLHEHNIIPIFFVKNSESNMIVENIPSIKYEFNSDLHWAYSILDKGSRSSLFLYTDSYNNENSKLFCYFKTYASITPQRIEFHPKTYELYSEYFPKLFDLIYYLMLVHGDTSNPQIRPIAISEMYAREVIRTLNIELLLKNSSLTKTMDQSRFGG
ncbi:hypothetical protein hrd7_15570 [Leptolinea sp. HRD-7]|nr:hypothetical protein hrd7_15570 [Leptolinea sp. HRD-7]